MAGEKNAINPVKALPGQANLFCLLFLSKKDKGG